MTKEKYVAMIVAKIKGSKETKKKAREQLGAKVEQAMEQGASLVDVIDKMGPASQVAKVWNEKIPKEEQKAYERVKRWKQLGVIAGILLVIFAACYYLLPRYYEIESDGIFSKTEVELQVQNVVAMLDAKEYEGLCDIATSDMQKVLNDTMIQAAKEEQVGGDWGAFVEFGQLYMSRMEYRGKTYAVTQITAEYENVSVMYSIAFDEDMKFTKLSMEKSE